MLLLIEINLIKYLQILCISYALAEFRDSDIIALVSDGGDIS